MESLCEDYGDLGHALSILARFEEAMAARQGQYTPAGSTAVQRGADLQKLGYGALRQHSLSKQVRATGALGLRGVASFRTPRLNCIPCGYKSTAATLAAHALTCMLAFRLFELWLVLLLPAVCGEFGGQPGVPPRLLCLHP